MYLCKGFLQFVCKFKAFSSNNKISLIFIRFFITFLQIFKIWTENN